MTSQALETKVVDKFKVSCDGGGANGHPRVWLQIPADIGWVECPYCDAKYVHSDHVEKS